MDVNQPTIIRLKNRVIKAGTEELIPCQGCNFFRVRSATAEFKVRFNGNSATQFAVGMSYRPSQDFETVTLVNETAVDITIDVVISDGDIGDDALTVANNLSVTVSNAGSVSTGTEVTVPANSSLAFFAVSTIRRSAIVKNPSKNLYPFRIGPNSVNTTTGVEIDPGDTYVVPIGGAAVWCFNTAPYPQSITRMYIND